MTKRTAHEQSRFWERADLHIHTTASDGTYSPAQIVELGRRAGLAALAVTDHDTTAGIAAALEAARETRLEVIPGVEITTEFRGRELHLLAYFIALSDAALQSALASIRASRRERFAAMLQRLRELGVSVEDDGQHRTPDALGRRHLAELLVRQGVTGSVREAFQRFLHDGGRAVVAKKRLPVAEAIALVRGAGGVAAWAHPVYDDVREGVGELAALGLGAIEVVFPEARPSVSGRLRELALTHGLAVSGGSDCHGPGPCSVGACSVSLADLTLLRQRREAGCSVPCSRKSSKV